MKEIEIKTDYIKLDQFLKYAGIVQTGGEAKIMIGEGIVFVNSQRAQERGKKIRKGDIVEIKNLEKFVVI